MRDWLRSLLRDCRTPAARRLGRLLLAVAGIGIAELGRHSDGLRVAGFISILLSCTFAVSARAGLQADLLERERQFSYDAGRDDERSICEEMHGGVRPVVGEATGTDDPSAGGGTLLPFNRSPH